jgi:5'(3')-deoxyribonucleotidase
MGKSGRSWIELTNGILLTMRLKGKRNRVIIDVDGVLRDFIGSLIRVYLREYPGHKVKPVNSRKLEDFFPIKEKIYPFMDETFAWEILAEAYPYSETIEALEGWEKEFKIIIATTQPPFGRSPTFYWLGKHRVPCDEIHVTSEKHLLSGVALLDDFVDNLEKFAATGRLAVCMDRPWNRHWKGPRVKTVDDFFAIVSEYLKESEFDEGVLLA